MNNMNYCVRLLLSGLLIVLLSGCTEAGDTGSTVASGKGKEIDYWVAPMDANYRRDKPGKSPMGMDLVPVYKEQAVRKTGKKDSLLGCTDGCQLPSRQARQITDGHGPGSCL